MEQAKQKMLKARIRRRKQEQADPSDHGGPGEFTEATCGLPQDSLGVLYPPPVRGERLTTMLESNSGRRMVLHG